MKVFVMRLVISVKENGIQAWSISRYYTLFLTFKEKKTLQPPLTAEEAVDYSGYCHPPYRGGGQLI